MDQVYFVCDTVYEYGVNYYNASKRNYVYECKVPIRRMGEGDIMKYLGFDDTGNRKYLIYGKLIHTGEYKKIILQEHCIFKDIDSAKSACNTTNVEIRRNIKAHNIHTIRSLQRQIDGLDKLT